MELKTMLDGTIGKITSDKSLKDKFLKNPVKTLEGLLGIDLPDEKLKLLAEYAKARVLGQEPDDKAGGLKDKLDGLLDKTDLDDKLMDAAKKLFGDKK